jgi:CheY-like chemotaxis protein
MNETTTVLVVDDSRVSRMMARQFILSAKPGWAIEEAGTGEEALEKVKTVSPKLILIDVNMPGIGGMAAA